MPTAYIKRNGSWSQIKRIYMKRSGRWIPMLTGYIKRNGSWSKIFGAGPSLNSSPIISASLGGKLYDKYTSTTGSWDNAISYTYQWVRSDSSNGITSAISGATSSSYTTTISDDGMWIGCEVTATDSGGIFNQATSSLKQIIKYTPAINQGVTVTGKPAPGNTLTANASVSLTNAWTLTTDNTNDTSPDQLTYIWKYSDGTTATNNTNTNTYLVNSSDNYKTLICYVTGTNSGGSLTTPSNSEYIQSIYTFLFSTNQSSYYLYINTNNYINLDAAFTGTYPPYNDAWRTVAVYGGDFVQDSSSLSGSGNNLLKYWSDDNNFVIQNTTYVYAANQITTPTLGVNAYKVSYQARFNPANSYVDIKFLYVGSKVNLPSFVGMYQGNNLLSQGIAGPYFLTTGTVMRIYFDGSAGTTSGISFSQIPVAAMVSADGLSGGSADDGYTQLYLLKNQYSNPAVYFTSSTPTSTPDSLTWGYSTSANDYSYMSWTARTVSHSGTIISSGVVYGANDLVATGLTVANTNYYIQVTPINSQGQAGSIQYLTGKTSAPHASAPTSVSVSANSTYFDISWSGATNATIYRIYWGGSSTNNLDPATSYDYETVSSSWRWGLNNLDRNNYPPSYGSSYYFWVSASNGDGTWTAYSLARSSTSYSLTGTLPVLSASVSPSSGDAGSTTYYVTASATADPSPSISYSWQYFSSAYYAWYDIGSYNSSYSPPSNFNSTYPNYGVRCHVTATNAVGSTTSDLSITVNTPVPSYTVSWNANGGSVSPTSQTVKNNTVVYAPTPSRSGYSFLYWRDTLSVFSYLYQLSAGQAWTVNSDITFYAWWQVAGSAPTSVSVSGNNSLPIGGTFSWSSNGSPAPTYRIVIGYNSSSSSGPFTTKYDNGGGSSATSWRPYYDAGWAGAGYYRCTIIATNSYGSASGSTVVYMS